MENRVMEYEAPVFEFEEMQLAEDVADTCWGYAYAWFDANEDEDVTDEFETVKLSSLGLGENGCQGSSAVAALKKYFNDHFPEAGITDKECSTNVKERSRIGGSAS